MNLTLHDKASAIARIRELDEKLFLSDEESRDYKNRIEIVEEYDKQFRQQWKSERRGFFKSQLKKRYITEDQAQKKLSEVDEDADRIIGKSSTYLWGKAS